ncbi:MAG: hypothetical protein ACKO32_14895, partial [Planctomycetia bacterium]
VGDLPGPQALGVSAVQFLACHTVPWLFEKASKAEAVRFGSWLSWALGKCGGMPSEDIEKFVELMKGSRPGDPFFEQLNRVPAIASDTVRMASFRGDRVAGSRRCGRDFAARAC